MAKGEGGIFRRKGIGKYILIRDNDLKDQLKQAVEELNLEISMYILKRCIECNKELVYLPKEMVYNKVPLYVYETQREFYKCHLCNRIYWKGTHVRQVKEYLHGIFQNSVSEIQGLDPE